MAQGLLSQLLRSQPIVAIDIGSCTIKAMEVVEKRDTVEVTAVGTIATPDGALDNGVVVDKAAVSAAVADLLSSVGIQATTAATVVTDPSLVATRIQMPRSLQRTLHRSIRFEARKHVPFDIEQSLIECQVLDPHDRDSEQMTVLLVAVRNEVVTSRVEALEMARLDPVYVDVEQFASMRAYVYANLDPSVFTQTLALIRIGASFTEMTMVRNGAFVFPRIVPSAGMTMDRAIASALNVDVAEARALKEQRAVACRRDQVAALDEASRQVSQIVAPALEEIARDIQRSFIFLATQLSADPSSPCVDRVLLSGGAANMANIGPYLEGQLGVRVEIPNVFATTAIATQSLDSQYLAQLAPCMSVAVGLALRGPIAANRYPFSGAPTSDIVAPFAQEAAA
ncbi:MAG: type IV pilus assembly protein PilM [Armatimonadota bacterium]